MIFRIFAGLEPGTQADWFSGIATALAVVVALGGYWLLEWQRRQGKKEERRKLAHMFGVRCAAIVNRTNDINEHLWNPPNPANLEIADSDLWRRIQPLIGIDVDPLTTLAADEIALLIEIHETELLMKALLASSRYQSLVGSLQEYRNKYDQLFAMMPDPMSVDGLVVTHKLSMEQLLRIMPISNQLNYLIGALRELSRENLELSKILCAEYHPAMKSHFKGEAFLRIGIEPNDDATKPS